MSVKPSINGGCNGGSCGSQGTPDPQDQNIGNALSKIKNKLIVMSGKGGVGKSSFATNLAVTLAGKGFSTGLLDVDLHGPSITGMLGITGLLDVTEDQQVIPKTVELFKSRGGRFTAETMGVKFLGTLPFDSQVVKACDEGSPIAAGGHGGPFVNALDQVVQAIVGSL